MIGAVFGGCGAAPPPTAELALAPPTWVTDAPSWSGSSVEALRTGLETAPVAVQLADASACEPEDVGCHRRLAQSLSADGVVSTTLAELGGTVMVRVQVVDADPATAEEVRQVVVQEGSARRLGDALERIGEEIADPYGSAASPALYERWWFWASAAALVAAGTIAAILVVASEEGGTEPDVVIVPP